MDNDIEKTVKKVYKRWKGRLPPAGQNHPDEETLAAFAENKLSSKDADRLKSHMLSCPRCSQAAADGIRMLSVAPTEMPPGLARRSQELIVAEMQSSVLELVLALRDKVMELVSSTGDVLVGQELVPAALVRSRKLSEFKDEVTVLKDFRDIRVEVKVRSPEPSRFTVTILARDKQTQRPLRDVRISMLREGLELESYLAQEGKVVFEHVALGKYSIQILSLKEKLATVTIDVKV
ncbi:MAG: hypothetical protein PHT59_02260 [Candidatus Omnitrophica bacterium]|nr:hypothetical protein [Candidatus Omnitrophota bacterium]